jgi:hypothetical protein
LDPTTYILGLQDIKLDTSLQLASYIKKKVKQYKENGRNTQHC